MRGAVVAGEVGEVAAARVRQRRHLRPRRARVVLLRLSEAEHQVVAAAAATAGLTVAGFAAEAALAAARGVATPPAGVREALVELFAARAQVRRYGVLVDQAVAAWHTVGEPPGSLARAVAGAERATARVDGAVAELRRRLP